MLKHLPIPLSSVRFALIAAACILLVSCKRDKLVESSRNDRPAWVYGIERDHIIVEGKGRNHEEARQRAFTNVKESIVSAVAVNVASTVQMDVTEEVINDVRQFRENTQIQTTVASNFLRSLRGIQVGKATDWYWEERRTPEKVPYVVYHIKYPFSEAELHTYIAEWEALDAALNQELQSLGTKAERSQNVSELILLKTEAERLSKIFREPRRTLALNTAARIAQKLNDARLEVVDHQRGQLTVALRSNGTRLETADEIRFDSKCAGLVQQHFLGDAMEYHINYEVTYCNRADDRIILSTHIDGREVSLTTTIPADPEHVQIMIRGPLRLYRMQGHLHEWQLPIRLIDDEEVEITDIEIVLERVEGRFLASLSRRGRAGLLTRLEQPVGAIFTGKGDHLLRFEAPKFTNEADEVFSALFEHMANYRASGKVNYRRANGTGQGESRSHRFDQLPVSVK